MNIKGYMVFILLAITLASCSNETKVQSLVEKLSSVDSQVRNRAAHRLAEMGPDAAGAVSALTVTLNDNDWMVRNAAVFALQRIGNSEAEKALKQIFPIYIQALQNEDLAERLNATEGLGYFGRFGHEAIPALARTMQNSEILAEQYKGKDPRLEKFHNWIANQAVFSIQKLRPPERKNP